MLESALAVELASYRKEGSHDQRLNNVLYLIGLQDEASPWLKETQHAL